MRPSLLVAVLLSAPQCQFPRDQPQTPGAQSPKGQEAGGAKAQDSVTPESAAWRSAAIEHEYRRQFDEAILARAKGLVATDNVQERRELARMTSWYSALEYTLRLPQPSDRSPHLGPQISVGGGRILTLWEDLRVWDEESGALVFEPIPCDAVDARIDPSGRFAALWTADPAGHGVMDLGTGQWRVAPIAAPGFHELRWSPGGEKVAWLETVDGLPTLTVWNVEQGRRVYAAVVAQPDGDEPCFSHDGRYLAHCDGLTIKIHDLADGDSKPFKVPLLDSGGLSAILCATLCFHPTEALLGISTYRESVRVWDVDTRAWASDWMMGNCHGGQDGARTLAFDPAFDRWVTARPEVVYSTTAKNGLAAGRPLTPDELVDEHRAGYSDLPHDLSHDGQLFAAGGVDDSIRVWNTRTGERLSPVLHHGPTERPDPGRQIVTQVHFTPSGRLVSVDRQGLVRVWSLAELRGGYRPVNDAGARFYILPTGRYAVKSTRRGELCAFDPGRAKPIHLPCPKALATLAVSADGSTLAAHAETNSRYETAGLWTWDLTKAEPVPQSVSDGRAPFGLALSHDGSKLATFRHMTLDLWDLNAMRLRKQYPAFSSVHDAAFAGQTLWASGDSFSGRLEEDLKDQLPAPYGEREQVLAGDGSGSVLWRESGDGYDWRWPDGRIDSLPPLVWEPYDPEASPVAAGGGRIVAIDDYGTLVLLYDLDARRFVRRWSFPEEIDGITLNGDRLVVWGKEILMLFDAEDGSVIAKHQPRGPLLHAVGVPGSDRVLASMVHEEFASIDAVTGEVMGSATPTRGRPNSVVPAGDHHAFVAEDDGGLFLLELATGSSTKMATNRRAFALSPDGSRILTLDGDDVVRLRDIESDREVYRKEAIRPRPVAEWGAGPSRRFRASQHIQFGPKGERVLIGAPRGGDPENKNRPEGAIPPVIVHPDTGIRISTLKGASEDLFGARFSPDGLRLLTWSKETFEAWDTDSGERRLSVHLGQEITNARIQPDGDTVAVTGNDGRLAAWSMEEGSPLYAPVDTGLSFLDADMNAEGSLAFGVDQEGRYHLFDLSQGTQRNGDTLFVSPKFGPGGQVLLGTSALAEIHEDGVVQITPRRWAYSELLWGLKGRSPVLGLIDSSRAIWGCCAADGQAALNVLDFSPAKDDPLSGTPEEILAEWTKRLGLEGKKSGSPATSLLQEE